MKLPDKKPRKSLERDIVAEIRNAVGRFSHAILHRNNVGSMTVCAHCKPKLCHVCSARFRNPFKFGLCEGSSDLIGAVAYTIQPEDVGKTIGRYAGVEVKKPGNKPTAEQLRFMAVMRKYGCAMTWVDSEEKAMQFLNEIATRLEP